VTRSCVFLAGHRSSVFFPCTFRIFLPRSFMIWDILRPHPPHLVCIGLIHFFSVVSRLSSPRRDARPSPPIRDLLLSHIPTCLHAFAAAISAISFYAKRAFRPFPPCDQDPSTSPSRRNVTVLWTFCARGSFALSSLITFPMAILREVP